MPQFKSFSLALLLLALVLATTPLSAEEEAKKDESKQSQATNNQSASLDEKKSFSCRAEIKFSYLLKPEPRKPKEPPPAPPKETEEHYETLVEQAETEKEAKEKIISKLEDLKKEALTHCKSIHENTSACIFKKVNEMQPEYNTRWDFYTRSSFRSAAEKDCIAIRGDCLEASSNEISCTKVEDSLEKPKADADRESKEEKK